MGCGGREGIIRNGIIDVIGHKTGHIFIIFSNSSDIDLSILGNT